MVVRAHLQLDHMLCEYLNRWKSVRQRRSRQYYFVVVKELGGFGYPFNLVFTLCVPWIVWHVPGCVNYLKLVLVLSNQSCKFTRLNQELTSNSRERCSFQLD